MDRDVRTLLHWTENTFRLFLAVWAAFSWDSRRPQETYFCLCLFFSWLTVPSTSMGCWDLTLQSHSTCLFSYCTGKEWLIKWEIRLYSKNSWWSHSPHFCIWFRASVGQARTPSLWGSKTCTSWLSFFLHRNRKVSKRRRQGWRKVHRCGD